jgi:hypothetical protein
MAIDDFVRDTDEEGNPTFEITDMKAFGAELLAMLGEKMFCQTVPVIQILNEEEYTKMHEESKHRYSEENRTEEHADTSVFDHIIESAKIKDKHKDNPLIYGEELAHGLRFDAHTRSRPNSEPVNEFFGWLGQDITYYMLKERKAFKNMPYNSSIKGLAKQLKKCSDDWNKNERKMKRTRKLMVPLYAKQNELHENEPNAVLSHAYENFGSDICDVSSKNDYKMKLKELKKGMTGLDEYLSELKIDDESRKQLKEDIFRYIKILKSGDERELKHLLADVCIKEKRYERASVELRKVNAQIIKLSDDLRNCENNKKSIQSSYNHFEGYLVASVAYPVASRDSRILHRTEEEVRHIYFEPVLDYDWTHFSSDNKIWDKTWDKVINEIYGRAKETKLRSDTMQKIRLIQAGVI